MDCFHPQTSAFPLKNDQCCQCLMVLGAYILVEVVVDLSAQLSGVVNRVAIWFYYRKAFATAFAVLSRAQFWLSRREIGALLSRSFRAAFARGGFAFAEGSLHEPEY